MTAWPAAVVLAVVFLAEVSRGTRVSRVRHAFTGRSGRLLGLRSLLVLMGAVTVTAAVGSAPPGATEPVRQEEATTLVLAIDVSRSMTVADVTPDRLSVAIGSAIRLVASMPVDRIGLVSFAADAHLLVPPTTDRALVTSYLEALDPDQVGVQGSDLADAVAVALAALPVSAAGPVPGGSVVVISDGEGFGPPDRQAAALDEASSRGVPVHWLTVGTEAGGEVPGTTGVSRADRTMGNAAARITGGLDLNVADPRALGTLAGSYRPRTHGLLPPVVPEGPEPPPIGWLAAVAALALAAEFLMSQRAAGLS